MRIEEIILDGFKSYATRTVIPGWDPEFNAITGLNGHGKSNVLDAICFVLGITNLSTVRIQLESTNVLEASCSESAGFGIQERSSRNQQGQCNN